MEGWFDEGQRLAEASISAVKLGVDYRIRPQTILAVRTILVDVNRGGGRCQELR